MRTLYLGLGEKVESEDAQMIRLQEEEGRVEEEFSHTFGWVLNSSVISSRAGSFFSRSLRVVSAYRNTGRAGNGAPIPL